MSVATADPAELHEIAQRARWLALTTVTESKAGHFGGPMSAMDLLVVLFFATMRIRPEEPGWPDRDRFVLSKGHSSIALYVVMALRGYFDVAELATFDKLDSRLQGHPDRTKLPGLDASTGSLGQGLAYGAGLALGARRAGSDAHTWVMVGDGELQEGMVWESVHLAARYRLDNLTAIVDANGLQQFGWAGTGADRADRRDPWHGTDLACKRCPAMAVTFAGLVRTRLRAVPGVDEVRAPQVHASPRTLDLIAHRLRPSTGSEAG